MTRKKIIYIIIITLTVSILSFLFLPVFQNKKESVFDYFITMDQKNLFQKAKSLYNEGDYQGSLEKYQKISIKYPEDLSLFDDIFFGIGRCQEKLENNEEVLESFQKIIENYPQSIYIPESLYHSACIYAEEEDLEKAEEYCDKILNEYPQTKQSTVKLVNQLKLLIAQRIAEKPIRSLLKEAQDFLNEEKYEEALGKYQELMKEYPDSDFAKNALFYVGWIQVVLEKTEEALISFQELINNYPENNHLPKALYHSAIIYTYNPEKEDLEKAEEYCDKILNEYPDIGEYWINLTNQLKSEILVEKLYRKADTLYKEKQYIGALEKYQELIEKYPDSTMIDDTLMAIGSCYLNLNENNQALLIFEEIIENYPNSRYFPKAVYHSALIYEDQENFEKAEEFCRKILGWGNQGKNEEIINKIKDLLEKFKNL